MPTVKGYLESIVKILNSNLDKKYIIKCFDYPIQYGYTEKSTFIEDFIQKEHVIAITTNEFDVQGMFQGFLTYPEEYPEFYSAGEFILCFGPSENMNCETIINSKVTDTNLYTTFYGIQNFEGLLENNKRLLIRK